MLGRRPARVVTVAALAAAVLGCGVATDLPPPSADTSSVNLGFAVANDLTISFFDYTVAGPGYGPVMGRIQLGDPNASVSALVGGVPSGLGYTLSLSARTDDGGTFCDAVSTFDVVAPTPTTLDVSMVCISANGVRIVDVDGVAHTCPEIASTTIARTGDALTLSASAFSFDDAPLTFLWEASDGALGSPEAAVTSYACGAAGVVRLRATVSNGSCTGLALPNVTCPIPP